jgi:integrase
MSTPQLALLDLAPEYWQRLQDIQDKLMQSSKAPNTLKAYAHAWKVFSGWCAEVGHQPLPAKPETVSKFITWSLYERERRYRLESVRITLTAITLRHLDQKLASPVTAEVKNLVRNAARDLKEGQGGKEALTPTQLRRICAKVSNGSTIGARDRAMFMLQFAAGWRCSEVAGLKLADIRFTRQGYVVRLGASKTDQDGHEGREVGIPPGEHELTCPVRALRTWIERRGRWQGPLFCRVNSYGQVVERAFAGDTITERLHLALRAIGENPAAYGSHSFRSGMVTSAIERGSSETLIMLRTGHKSLDTMRRYVRRAKLFGPNPLAGAL